MGVFGRPALRLLAGAAVAVGAVALSGGCASSPPKAGGRIEVVAAENFWGDIAAQIGGTRVHTQSFISDPTADPHLFESNARDAAALASARVVVENGLGYDDFIDKLLSTTSNHSRHVVSAAKVGDITANDANPHLWYDMVTVRAVAKAIEVALVDAAPAHKAEFGANLERFDRSLLPIEAAITDIRTRFAGAPVAYTERVPGYLLAAAGLDVKTPAGFARAIEDGNEPSARDADRMLSLMRDRGVRVLLYNAQATSKVTSRIRDAARAAGIPVVAVTETMPRSEHSYQAWQLHQVQALRDALVHASGS